MLFLASPKHFDGVLNFLISSRSHRNIDYYSRKRCQISRRFYALPVPRAASSRFFFFQLPQNETTLTDSPLGEFALDRIERVMKLSDDFNGAVNGAIRPTPVFPNVPVNNVTGRGKGEGEREHPREGCFHSPGAMFPISPYYRAAHIV